jgi:site-specific recombinase XerD
VQQRVIPTVSDDDFRKLLRLTDPALYRSPARNFRAVRDQAMLWLLLDTPGRQDELARLTLENVDLRERRVLVEGKGRKERYMYLGAVTTKAMGRYKMQRDTLDPWTDDWWVDCHGRPMNRAWLHRVLKRLGQRAGIPNLHPHMFRHTFSVRMIESDVPLPTLEVMGGWVRIPQTYLATLGDRAARAAHRRVSPADRLTGRG